jgi:hypothetical protein
MIASARGDAEQPNPVSGSFALWDLRRCYQSRLQDQETAICARLRNYGEGEGFDEREINCPLSSVRIDASDASG